MDCKVHGVAKSRTQLSDFHLYLIIFYFVALHPSRWDLSSLLLLGFVCDLWESPGEIRLSVKWEDWGFKFCFCHLISFTPNRQSRREALYLSYGDNSCPPELAEVDQFT